MLLHLQKGKRHLFSQEIKSTKNKLGGELFFLQDRRKSQQEKIVLHRYYEKS